MLRYGILAALISTITLVAFFSPYLHQFAYRLTLKRMVPGKAPVIDVNTAASHRGQALFLDARAREEFEVSHIKNAHWVGFEEFGPEKVTPLPKDSEIIVYCSVGYRSDLIADRMQALGFRNVKNMYGGIFEWVNSGNPVFANGRLTDSVHAFDKSWGIWLRKGKKVYGTN